MLGDDTDGRDPGRGEPAQGSSGDSYGETVFPGTPVVLGADALRIDPMSSKSRSVRYAQIIHMGRSSRGLAFSTRRQAILIRREYFANEDAVDALQQALLQRIRALDGGEQVLKRMEEIDRLQIRRRPRGAVYGFSLLCLLAYWLQSDDGFVTSVGTFVPSLVMQGEYWRLASANFLHNMLLFPYHIGLNLLCVVIFGFFTERVLGSARTIVVMGLSGITAMLAAGAMGYTQVVGASGVAAGLAGALVSIEFGGARGLPVWWRIPRNLLLLAMAFQVGLDVLMPFVAGAAHMGGFVAGYLVTRILLENALRMRTPTPGIRGLAFAMVAFLVWTGVEAAPLISRDSAALERHGMRLLQVRDSSGYRDNEAAWRILTESEPTERGVEVALALAERAADFTAWSDPDVLDTLAEALFAAGDPSAAIHVIDRAIAITRGERYFVEQRRRFTGERDADDRPEAPTAPWRPDGPPEGGPLLVPEGDAIRI